MSLFDDAKVRRFFETCKTFNRISVRKHIIIDLNQAFVPANMSFTLRIAPFYIIYLVFRSLYTTFATKNKLFGYEELEEMVT